MVENIWERIVGLWHRILCLFAKSEDEFLETWNEGEDSDECAAPEMPFLKELDLINKPAKKKKAKKKTVKRKKRKASKHK
jgi:hypothetical protein